MGVINVQVCGDMSEERVISFDGPIPQWRQDCVYVAMSVFCPSYKCYQCSYYYTIVYFLASHHKYKQFTPVNNTNCQQ